MMDTGSGRGVPSGPSLGASHRRLTLHFGVLVQPYRAGRRAMTTYDVAQILEHKYGVMGAYFRVHQKDVVKAVESSMMGALEALAMGARVDPWARGMGAIERGFRDFIASREVERVGIPGTPTKAAQRGQSQRFKSPRAGGRASRSSFRNTGLYMTSFKAWAD